MVVSFSQYEFERLVFLEVILLRRYFCIFFFCFLLQLEHSFLLQSKFIIRIWQFSWRSINERPFFWSLIQSFFRSSSFLIGSLSLVNFIKLWFLFNGISSKFILRRNLFNRLSQLMLFWCLLCLQNRSGNISSWSCRDRGFSLNNHLDAVCRWQCFWFLKFCTCSTLNSVDTFLRFTLVFQFYSLSP